jgi:gliding motility-associated-like protein
MSWLTTNSVTTATSPNYPTTNCGNINYSINCSKPFKRTNNGAPYNNNCLIFPSDISITNTFLTMTITFNQPVNNLKIRFIDLDENVSGFSQPEESISQINPPASSVTPLNLAVNSFFLVGGIVTPFDNVSTNNNNNASGWVNWTGNLTSVNFRYNRPGELYALIIDSIYFDCPNCLVDCNPIIEMPNTFSPNDDEINELFTPIFYKNIKYANLIIVNRWGNLIYEETNLLSGWDGTSNGKECTEGVYFWKIDYEDFNTTKLTSQGFLHLIR